MVKFFMFFEIGNREIINWFLKKVVEKEIKNVFGIIYFESFLVIVLILLFLKLNILKEFLIKINLVILIWKF